MQIVFLFYDWFAKSEGKFFRKQKKAKKKVKSSVDRCVITAANQRVDENRQEFHRKVVEGKEKEKEKKVEKSIPLDNRRAKNKKFLCLFLCVAIRRSSTARIMWTRVQSFSCLTQKRVNKFKHKKRKRRQEWRWKINHRIRSKLKTRRT